MSEPVHVGALAKEMGAQLARIAEVAKNSPRIKEETSLCRCSSFWKDGKERTVGWVESSSEGRGTWRTCERCNKKGAVKTESSKVESFS